MQITHVAIWFDGKVWKLPAPNRHIHVVQHIIKVTGKGLCGPSTYGFTTESGGFLSRKAAFALAIQTGQISSTIAAMQSNIDELYSEDIW
jgi:hypothetical protein